MSGSAAVWNAVGLCSPPERVSCSAAVWNAVGLCPPIGCTQGAGLPSPPERVSGSAAVWNAVGLCSPVGCARGAGLLSPRERVSGSAAVWNAVGLCPPIGCMPHVPPERVRGSAVGLGVMLLHPPVGCALCAGLPLLPEREGGSDAVSRAGGFLGWAREGVPCSGVRAARWRTRTACRSASQWRTLAYGTPAALSARSAWPTWPWCSRSTSRR